MGEISIVYDQETGAFIGLKVKKKLIKAEDMEDANTEENINWLSNFDWVQHEHVELYHRIKGSICSIHVRCKLYKWC